MWGIVPLYFALLLCELTSVKKSFRTAIQTGFSFLWAEAQWPTSVSGESAPRVADLFAQGFYGVKEGGYFRIPGMQKAFLKLRGYVILPCNSGLSSRIEKECPFPLNAVTYVRQIGHFVEWFPASS